MNKKNKIKFLHPTKTGGSSILVGLKTEYKINKTHKPLIDTHFYNKIDYSFCSVRNPYDRIISMFNFFNFKDLDDFLNRLENNFFKNNINFLPQHKYIESKYYKVNDIFYLEDFNNCWVNILQKKLDIKINPVKTNITNNKLNKILTNKQKDIIYNIYKEDFLLLNYKK